MSAEANIKEAYRKSGAKVLSIKRHTGNIYCVEIEINGRRWKRQAQDPSKINWRSKRMFERSLRELHRLSET